MSTAPVSGKTAATVPPLRHGDRLTLEEFERRYNAMPWVKKAELLEGVVYMAAAVRFEGHGEEDSDLNLWLGLYRLRTPGVRTGLNTSAKLDLRSMPQPDGLMLIDPVCGGQATIDEQGYIRGAPELAGEISSSSADYDLGVKLEVFQKNRVREYIVWRVDDRAIDWFLLRGDQYERLPLVDGVYKSEVFPGLWLDPEAMVNGDLARVEAVLRQGIASPEHAAFVARLQKK